MTFAAIGIQFGNLGLHASNTYYVAKDRALLPSLVGNTFFVSFIIGGIGAGFAFILFFLWPNLAPIHGPLLTLALMWIPVGLAYMLLQNILLGIHEVRAYNMIELVMQIVGVALIGMVIILNLVTVEMIFLTGVITVFVSFVWAFWRIKPHLSYNPTVSFPLFIDNIQYGIKAYLAAFFAFLVLRADLLMVKYMLGTEQAGYYSIAVSMADMISTLPVVAGTILFPKLSALINDHEKWQLTKKTARGIGIIMIIFTVCSVVLARPIIEVLFGEPFLPAVPAFIWLLPGIVLLSINVIYMNYFASTGMPPITIYSPAIATICNILLNLKLIPIFGIVGASLASVFSYGLMLAGSVIYISRMKRTSS
jgi:O-antigen/teichoic acid export membrane protein